MRRAALVLLALCLPLAAQAATLEPFVATYAIRWGGLNAGTGTVRLDRIPGANAWSYESRVQGRGLFRLAISSSQNARSEFDIVNGRVVPQTYTAGSEQRIEFDWTRGRVTGEVDGKPFDLPTQPGLLDEQSVQVALMQELMSGRTPSRFVLVDENRIKDYLYAVEGSEVIESVAGTFRTDIYSSRRPGSRKATYFWCAPELGYIPLKVERRDGKSVEWSMRLTSLQR